MANNNLFIFDYPDYKKYYRGVDKDQLDILLNTHPHPYSLKSINDLFFSLGLSGKAYKIPKSKIHELAPPFIAQFEAPEEFVIVRKMTESDIFYQDSRGSNKSSKVDFISKWSGIIYNVDLTKRLKRSTLWKQKSKVFLKIDNKYSIFYVSFLLLVLFYILTKPINSYIWFIFLLLIPIIAVYNLLKIEYGDTNDTNDKICNFGHGFSCHEMLKSKLARPFGLFSLAELGFVLFVFLYFLIINLSLKSVETKNIFEIVFFIGLLLTPFSLFFIGYQVFKIGKICPFCMIVQISILLFGVLYFFFPLTLPGKFIQNNINSFIYSLLMAILFIIGLSKIMLYKTNMKTSEFERYKFKRSEGIITNMIKNSTWKLNGNKNLLLKIRDGEPFITFALSLRCSHCSRAFEEFKHIADTVSNIGLGIIIIFNKEEELKLGGFLAELVSDSKNSNDVWVTKLGNWYQDPSYRRLKDSLPANNKITQQYINWTDGNNISYAPMFFFQDLLVPQEISVTDLSDYLRINYS